MKEKKKKKKCATCDCGKNVDEHRKLHRKVNILYDSRDAIEKGLRNFCPIFNVPCTVLHGNFVNPNACYAFESCVVSNYFEPPIVITYNSEDA